MSIASRFAALGLLAFGAYACAQPTEMEETNANVDDLTSASQLGGSNMAAGTYSLTFDDGPGPRTEELANWLGDRGIVATFFINGKNAAGHEAALRAIKARGHILANHTHDHENMTSQTGDALHRAVADTDAIIAQYQPAGPWLLRAPYGAWSGRVSEELNATDMKKYVGSIFWNVGGELTASYGADWACWGQGLTVSDCGDRYMNEMRDRGRGVILMHDSHSRSVDLAKTVVEAMSGTASFLPLTAAPQIAEALGGRAPSPPPSPEADTCDSYTLGRSVPAGTCVKRNDDQTWYRCAAGDWTPVPASSDPSCTACPQVGACR